MIKVLIVLCAINEPTACTERTVRAQVANTPFWCAQVGLTAAASVIKQYPNLRVKRIDCTSENIMDGLKERFREKARSGTQEDTGGNPEAVR